MNANISKTEFFRRRNHNQKIFIIVAVAIVAILATTIILVAVSAGKKKASSEEEQDKVVYDTSITGDAEQDPENVETEEEDGADVDVQDLSEERGRSNGIDVSKWQGKIDWQKVKKAVLNLHLFVLAIVERTVLSIRMTMQIIIFSRHRRQVCWLVSISSQRQ